MAIDRAGKFAYVANWNDGTISQYTISPAGVLVSNGSVPSGGYNPRMVVISPGGFLYCGNANSASVTEFAINAPTGALAMVHNFDSGPGGGPLWLSFDPIGRFAYVGGYTEIAKFKVNPISGALTTNGTVAFTKFILWGQVDPSGKFPFRYGCGWNGLRIQVKQQRHAHTGWLGRLGRPDVRRNNCLRAPVIW